jgi:NADH-quinone oxidoreductase subunit J
VNVVFWIAAAVAIVATLVVITRTNAMHALLYLVISLFAVAVIFASLGAPFVAALEVIIYAGAIIVLFLFAVMLLDPEALEGERGRLRSTVWLGPGALTLVLLVELIWVIVRGGAGAHVGTAQVGPHAVGLALFGPYALAVELASMLLLAALVGARHLGRRGQESEEDVCEILPGRPGRALPAAPRLERPQREEAP